MADYQKRIGGIYENSNAKGMWLSGSITVNGETVKFVAFRNPNKPEGSNFPDFEIFPPKPRADR